MDIAFQCKLKLGSDIAKLSKFMGDSGGVSVALGKHGIRFSSVTEDGSYLYAATIYGNDIFSLWWDENKWPEGAKIRHMDFKRLNGVLSTKGSDLIFMVDTEATTLNVKIITKSRMEHGYSIPLSEGYMDIPPNMTWPKAELTIDDLKTLCKTFGSGNRIEVLFNNNGILFRDENGNNWNQNLDTNDSNIERGVISSSAFRKVNQINKGSAKNTLAGIYIEKNYPCVIMVKLDIVVFTIVASQLPET